MPNYKPRGCDICGDRFTPTGPAGHYCPSCQLVVRDQHRARARKLKVDHECEVCGRSFLDFATVLRCSAECRHAERTSKHCYSCSRDLPLDRFGRDASRGDRHDARCRQCRAEAQRATRERNPDKYRAYFRKRAQAHRHKKAGFDPETYELLWARQDGKCAICGMAPKPTFHLALDHDHATGEARGLLCRPCNLGLGNFVDDPARLSAAIQYLTIVLS